MRSKQSIARWLMIFVLIFGMTTVFFGTISAQDDAGDSETTEEVVESVDEEMSQIDILTANLDTVWMLLAGFLVFFMQSGFALVEAGFVRAKNVTNILMKNFFDLALGSIVFWAFGFGIMFGTSNGFFGTDWFFLNGIPDVFPGLTVPTLAFFFFQFAFAATAATIASGAMAGRTEFVAYLGYSFIVTALIYPIVGHWIWGGGWLASMETPFWDFAGSTVVHSTGAWVGLVGAIFLGARRGRFGSGSAPIPGHSMTLATLGTFILWLGWFGFNPGSQLNADGASIALITVTTNLAAAAGAITSMFLGWYFLGKPQLPWALNGALAGLVAITAPTAFVTPSEAVIIGAIGGAVMYFGVALLENFKIDDPIGAVAVHGFCGVWGTLAVGIFANVEGGPVGLLHGGGFAQLTTQVIGVVAVGAFVIISAVILFSILKATVGLRVPVEGELLGLDIYEHGMVNYPEFTNSPSEPIPTNGSSSYSVASNNKQEA
jgi:ammonium transporter, Amt family